MNQNIEKIVNTNDGHTIISNNKQYKTKLIFDSRPDFIKKIKDTYINIFMVWK